MDAFLSGDELRQRICKDLQDRACAVVPLSVLQSSNPPSAAPQRDWWNVLVDAQKGTSNVKEICSEVDSLSRHSYSFDVLRNARCILFKHVLDDVKNCNKTEQESLATPSCLAGKRVKGRTDFAVNAAVKVFSVLMRKSDASAKQEMVEFLGEYLADTTAFTLTGGEGSGFESATIAAVNAELLSEAQSSNTYLCVALKMSLATGSALSLVRLVEMMLQHQNSMEPLPVARDLAHLAAYSIASVPSEPEKTDEQGVGQGNGLRNSNPDSSEGFPIEHGDDADLSLVPVSDVGRQVLRNLARLCVEQGVATLPLDISPTPELLRATLVLLQGRAAALPKGDRASDDMATEDVCRTLAVLRAVIEAMGRANIDPGCVNRSGGGVLREIHDAVTPLATDDGVAASVRAAARALCAKAHLFLALPERVEVMHHLLAKFPPSGVAPTVSAAFVRSLFVGRGNADTLAAPSRRAELLRLMGNAVSTALDNCIPGDDALAQRRQATSTALLSYLQGQFFVAVADDADSLVEYATLVLNTVCALLNGTGSEGKDGDLSASFVGPILSDLLSFLKVTVQGGDAPEGLLRALLSPLASLYTSSARYHHAVCGDAQGTATVACGAARSVRVRRKDGQCSASALHLSVDGVPWTLDLHKSVAGTLGEVVRALADGGHTCEKETPEVVAWAASPLLRGGVDEDTAALDSLSNEDTESMLTAIANKGPNARCAAPRIDGLMLALFRAIGRHAGLRKEVHMAISAKREGTPLEDGVSNALAPVALYVLRACRSLEIDIDSCDADQRATLAAGVVARGQLLACSTPASSPVCGVGKAVLSQKWVSSGAPKALESANVKASKTGVRNASAVIAFLRSTGIKAEDVQEVLAAREVRASARLTALECVAELASRQPGAPGLYELVSAVASAVQTPGLRAPSRFRGHWLDGIDGCKQTTGDAVSAAFAEIVRAVACVLPGDDGGGGAVADAHGDPFVRAAVLSLLNVQYRGKDHAFLTGGVLRIAWTAATSLAADADARAVEAREELEKQEKKAKAAAEEKKATEEKKKATADTETAAAGLVEGETAPEDGGTSESPPTPATADAERTEMDGDTNVQPDADVEPDFLEPDLSTAQALRDRLPFVAWHAFCSLLSQSASYSVAQTEGAKLQQAGASLGIIGAVSPASLVTPAPPADDGVRRADASFPVLATTLAWIRDRLKAGKPPRLEAAQVPSAGLSAPSALALFVSLRGTEAVRAFFTDRDAVAWLLEALGTAACPWVRLLAARLLYAVLPHVPFSPVFPEAVTPAADAYSPRSSPRRPGPAFPDVDPTQADERPFIEAMFGLMAGVAQEEAPTHAETVTILRAMLRSRRWGGEVASVLQAALAEAPEVLASCDHEMEDVLPEEADEGSNGEDCATAPRLDPAVARVLAALQVLGGSVPLLQEGAKVRVSHTNGASHTGVVARLKRTEAVACVLADGNGADADLATVSLDDVFPVCEMEATAEGLPDDMVLCLTPLLALEAENLRPVPLRLHAAAMRALQVFLRHLPAAQRFADAGHAKALLKVAAAPTRLCRPMEPMVLARQVLAVREAALVHQLKERARSKGKADVADTWVVEVESEPAVQPAAEAVEAPPKGTEEEGGNAEEGGDAEERVTKDKRYIQRILARPGMKMQAVERKMVEHLESGQPFGWGAYMGILKSLANAPARSGGDSGEQIQAALDQLRAVFVEPGMEQEDYGMSEDDEGGAARDFDYTALVAAASEVDVALEVLFNGGDDRTDAEGLCDDRITALEESAESAPDTVASLAVSIIDAAGDALDAIMSGSADRDDPNVAAWRETVREDLERLRIIANDAAASRTSSDPSSTSAGISGETSEAPSAAASGPASGSLPRSESLPPHMELASAAKLHFSSLGLADALTDEDFAASRVDVNLVAAAELVRSGGKRLPDASSTRPTQEAEMKCAKGHIMSFSSYFGGPYRGMGWKCDRCTRTSTKDARWFCPPCTSDICSGCAAADGFTPPASSISKQALVKLMEADPKLSIICERDPELVDNMFRGSTPEDPFCGVPLAVKRRLQDIMSRQEDDGTAPAPSSPTVKGVKISRDDNRHVERPDAPGQALFAPPPPTGEKAVLELPSLAHADAVLAARAAVKTFLETFEGALPVLENGDGEGLGALMELTSGCPRELDPYVAALSSALARAVGDKASDGRSADGEEKRSVVLDAVGAVVAGSLYRYLLTRGRASIKSVELTGLPSGAFATSHPPEHTPQNPSTNPEVQQVREKRQRNRSRELQSAEKIKQVTLKEKNVQHVLVTFDPRCALGPEGSVDVYRNPSAAVHQKVGGPRAFHPFVVPDADSIHIAVLNDRNLPDRWGLNMAATRSPSASLDVATRVTPTMEIPLLLLRMVDEQAIGPRPTGCWTPLVVRLLCACISVAGGLGKLRLIRALACLLDRMDGATAHHLDWNALELCRSMVEEGLLTSPPVCVARQTTHGPGTQSLAELSVAVRCLRMRMDQVEKPAEELKPVLKERKAKAQAEPREEEDACPLCGKLFPVSKLPMHANACLDMGPGEAESQVEAETTVQADSQVDESLPNDLTDKGKAQEKIAEMEVMRIHPVPSSNTAIVSELTLQTRQKQDVHRHPLRPFDEKSETDPFFFGNCMVYWKVAGERAEIPDFLCRRPAQVCADTSEGCPFALCDRCYGIQYNPPAATALASCKPLTSGRWYFEATLSGDALVGWASPYFDSTTAVGEDAEGQAWGLSLTTLSVWRRGQELTATSKVPVPKKGTGPPITVGVLADLPRGTLTWRFSQAGAPVTSVSVPVDLGNGAGPSSLVPAASIKRSGNAQFNFGDTAFTLGLPSSYEPLKNAGALSFLAANAEAASLLRKYVAGEKLPGGFLEEALECRRWVQSVVLPLESLKGGQFQGPLVAGEEWVGGSLRHVESDGVAAEKAEATEGSSGTTTASGVDGALGNVGAPEATGEVTDEGKEGGEKVENGKEGEQEGEEVCVNTSNFLPVYIHELLLEPQSSASCDMHALVFVEDSAPPELGAYKEFKASYWNALKKVEPVDGVSTLPMEWSVASDDSKMVEGVLSQPKIEDGLSTEIFLPWPDALPPGPLSVTVETIVSKAMEKGKEADNSPSTAPSTVEDDKKAAGVKVDSPEYSSPDFGGFESLFGEPTPKPPESNQGSIAAAPSPPVPPPPPPSARAALPPLPPTPVTPAPPDCKCKGKGRIHEATVKYDDGTVECRACRSDAAAVEGCSPCTTCQQPSTASKPSAPPPPPVPATPNKKAQQKSPFECPLGHELHQMETPDATFTCSLCFDKQPRRATMFGCKPCKWNECETCQAGGASSAATSAPKPPVPPPVASPATPSFAPPAPRFGSRLFGGRGGGVFGSLKSASGRGNGGSMWDVEPTPSPTEKASSEGSKVQFGLWEWQEKGKWKPYDNATLVLISDAVEDGRTAVDVTIGSSTYTLDLVAKTQTNTLTSMVRNIRFVPLPPHEHELKLCTRMTGWSCDARPEEGGCLRGGKVAAGKRYKCAEGCNFDYCDRCHLARLPSAVSSSAPPSPTLEAVAFVSTTTDGGQFIRLVLRGHADGDVRVRLRVDVDAAAFVAGLNTQAGAPKPVALIHVPKDKAVRVPLPAGTCGRFLGVKLFAAEEGKQASLAKMLVHGQLAMEADAIANASQSVVDGARDTDGPLLEAVLAEARTLKTNAMQMCMGSFVQDGSVVLKALELRGQCGGCSSLLEFFLRYSVFCRLADLAARLLPYADLRLIQKAPAAFSRSPLAETAALLRRVLSLHPARAGLWRDALDETATLGSDDVVPEFSFDRSKATQAERPASDSLLGQLARQLVPLPSRRIKPIEPAQQLWKAIFAGSRAQDDGGPFREVISCVSDEMQGDLGLLIAGDGEGSPFVLNPEARSPLMLEMYRAVGRLLGAVLRSHDLRLDIALPSLFWKQLVDEEVSPADFANFPTYTAHLVSWLRKATKEEFAAFDSIFGEELVFQYMDSAGVSRELFPHGATTPVGYDEVPRYVAMVEEAMMQESSLGMAAIRQGVQDMIPSWCLRLFTAQEIEHQSIVPPTIDYETMKKRAMYTGGLDSNSPQAKTLWGVLDQFTPGQMRHFVRFAWGQAVLPDRPLLVGPSSKKENPDELLPKVHTCTFAIEWPEYSTVDVAKARLLAALMNATDDIDLA